MKRLVKPCKTYRSSRIRLRAFKKLVTEAKKAEKAGKDIGDTWRKDVSRVLGAEFVGTLDDADSALQSMAIGTDAAMSSATSSIDSLESQILSLISATEQDLTIKPEVKQANLGPLYTLLSLINAIRQATGQSAVRSGGGGGGQSQYAKDIANMEHEVKLERMRLNASCRHWKRWKQNTVTERARAR